jgi:hypothetical protein
MRCLKCSSLSVRSEYGDDEHGNRDEVFICNECGFVWEDGQEVDESEVDCDPCTGLACGDECNGKSHATTETTIAPCSRCARHDTGDCDPCGPPAWESFLPIEGAGVTMERVCETCRHHEVGYIYRSLGFRGKPMKPCDWWNKPVSDTDPRPAAQDADECRNAFENYLESGADATDARFAREMELTTCGTYLQAEGFHAAWNRRSSLPVSAEFENVIAEKVAKEVSDEIPLYFGLTGRALAYQIVKGIEKYVAALKEKV